LARYERSFSIEEILRRTGGRALWDLQKFTYNEYNFIVIPLGNCDGIHACHAITAAFPISSDHFRTESAARTIHFFTLLPGWKSFLIIHL